MSNPATDKVKKLIPKEWKPSKRKMAEGLIDIAFSEGQRYEIKQCTKTLKEAGHGR